MYAIFFRSGGQWVQLAPVVYSPGTPFSQIRMAHLEELSRKVLMPAVARIRTVNYEPAVGDEVVVKLGWIGSSGATQFTTVFYGHVTSVQRVVKESYAVPTYDVECSSAIRSIMNSAVEFESVNVSLNALLSEIVAHCLNPTGNTWYETSYGFRCRAGSPPPFNVSVKSRPFNAVLRVTGRFAGRLGDLIDSLFMSVGQYVNELFFFDGSSASIQVVPVRAHDIDGYGYDYVDHSDAGAPPKFIRSVGGSSFRVSVRTVEVFSAPTRTVLMSMVQACDDGKPCVQLPNVCRELTAVYLVEDGQDVASLCEGSEQDVCDYYVDRSGDDAGRTRIVFAPHMLGRTVRIHYDAVKKVRLEAVFSQQGIAESRVLTDYSTASDLLPDYPSGAVLNMNDDGVRNYVRQKDYTLFLLSALSEPDAVGESVATYFGSPFRAFLKAQPPAEYEEVEGVLVGLRSLDPLRDGQVHEFRFDGRRASFTIKPTLMDDVVSAIKKLASAQSALTVTLARTAVRPARERNIPIFPI